jgi:Domain of Unknown Function (DUF748)
VGSSLSDDRARALAKRASEIARSRRTRTIATVVLALIVFLGIAAYIAVPRILRSVLTKQVATALHRPVSVGDISFNLYTLRLKLANLHIGEPSGSGAFVDLGGFNVKVSWMSLFRLAPIVGSVTVDQPRIHVVRNADGSFNFSDLLKPSAATPPSKPAAPSAPLKFAVSNIRVIDGDVRFDDQMLGQQHAIEKIQVGVPFIANLPSDVDVVVKPLLQMLIDGSPVRIVGETKPFGTSRDSVVDLKLHRLDLPRYAAYVPKSVPIKLPSGGLSFDVLVHFIQTDAAPSIRANGTISIDQFDLRDAANAPLLALEHGEVQMSDVEPLSHIAYIQAIRIIGLRSTLVRNHDGTTNLSGLSGPPPTMPNPQIPPAAAPTLATAPSIVATAPPANTAAPSIVTTAPAANSAAPSTVAAGPAASQQFDAAIDSFVMTDSVLNLTDLSGAKPAQLELDGIHVTMANLHTTGPALGTFDVGANIKSGGALGLRGSVNLPSSQAEVNLTADKIDLPGLQDFAQSVFVGKINSGKVTAHADVKALFAPGKLNVHTEPADFALDDLAIGAPRGNEQPITWKHFAVTLGQFDLASKQAIVKDVSSDGLSVMVTREHNGELSFQTLLRKAPPLPRETREQRLERRRRERRERELARRAPKKPVQPAEPPFKFDVESVNFVNTSARLFDRGASRPVRANLSLLNLRLKGISSDFAKSIDIELDGTLNRTGTFKVAGTAAIDPLKADLRIETKRLQLRDAQAYVNTKLNAEITSSALNMDGTATLARKGKDFRATYRGDVSLSSLNAIDKLTGDQFLKWSDLRFERIDADIGDGPPKVSIAKISLADFYARIILNSTGKLNLNDILANPQAAPKSLTRAEGEPGATVPQPTPEATPAPPPAAAPAAPQSPPIDADVTVDAIAFDNGKVDYTDDFINPHFTANLSDIVGKVGKIGTHLNDPADVSLQGHVNGSAPIDISGAVNPLAPMASIDIKAKADGIELTNFSPYTTKYTGYPIEKGTLTVDVHYMLNQGQLTADNHIFIDQLFFGDRVANSTAANLPIRLAVSLLKNSKGEIDLNIPISGSLSDPKFSLGGIILHAVVNLIMKAITSPFSLLASALGPSSGGHDLSYVVFAPGFAKLTPDAKSQLDTIAKALQERAALKMSICGRVDPNFDTEGLKEAMVEDAINEQKIKYLGSDAKGKDIEVTPSDPDYAKFLKRAYSKADIPKPRDAIGIARTLPPDEMKKLMVANTKITPDDLKKLANARANVVRRYLGDEKIDPVRLFLLAPKLNADGIKDGKTTRADLSLQ